MLPRAWINVAREEPDSQIQRQLRWVTAEAQLLMQAANDRREFSLMLAGCMVCSAAVGLATVMVLTLTGANRLEARVQLPPIPQLESGVSLDAIVLPWPGSPQSRPVAPE